METKNNRNTGERGDRIYVLKCFPNQQIEFLAFPQSSNSLFDEKGGQLPLFRYLIKESCFELQKNIYTPPFSIFCLNHEGEWCSFGRELLTEEGCWSFCYRITSPEGFEPVTPPRNKSQVSWMSSCFPKGGRKACSFLLTGLSGIWPSEGCISEAGENIF